MEILLKFSEDLTAPKRNVARHVVNRNGQMDRNGNFGWRGRGRLRSPQQVQRIVVESFGTGTADDPTAGKLTLAVETKSKMDNPTFVLRIGRWRIDLILINSCVDLHLPSQ